MFACLSGMPETVTTHRFQRSKRINQTVRTRTGRQITLSYRALSSYWGTKSYFFLQKPLKARVNSKYQSKGSTYMLHFLAFVEIRLFNVFFWERKAGFGKLIGWKTCGMRDSREKGAGMRDKDPPSSTLINMKGFSSNNINRKLIHLPKNVDSRR